MSEITYLTVEEGKNLSFGSAYKQCFSHDFSHPKTMPEYVLVKDFLAEPEAEKQMALEILKFLYSFTFATYKQIVRLLKQRGLEISGLAEVLQKLLDERKINSFYLNLFVQNGPIPEDALCIFCIDFGAIPILSHFSTLDCGGWFSTDCIRDSELISKYLSTTDFYLTLSEVQGKALRYFKPIFDVSYKHLAFRFSAVFEIVQDNLSHPFILESIRSYDLPVNWLKNIEKKILPFICGDQLWQKYFYKKPVFLLLMENEKDALEAGDMLYRRVGPDVPFRLITDQQVRKGLANAYFLKYIPQPDADCEHLGELKRVKPGLLSGK